MKKFFLAAALLIASVTVFAQDYNWAVGLRGGGDLGGLTIKRNFGGSAIEGTVAYAWNGGIAGDVAYEFNVPVIADGFNLYYGPGIVAAFGSNVLALGIEGVVGLEYKIPVAPIALSLDYRPQIVVSTADGAFAPGFLGFGLGIKFTF